MSKHTRIPTLIMSATYAITTFSQIFQNRIPRDSGQNSYITRFSITHWIRNRAWTRKNTRKNVFGHFYQNLFIYEIMGSFLIIFWSNYGHFSWLNFFRKDWHIFAILRVPKMCQSFRDNCMWYTVNHITHAACNT